MNNTWFEFRRDAVSERKGNNLKCYVDLLTLGQRPKSGRGCLTCAIFVRTRPTVFNHITVTLALDCFKGGGVTFRRRGDTALKALTTSYQGGG